MDDRLDFDTQTFSRAVVESYIERVKTPSLIQRAAYEYFSMGFSIGPTKPASKQPFMWRRLTYTRIDSVFIPELFDNDAGIFVVVGRISRNLAVLDCDSQQSFEYHDKKFRSRGLLPWKSRSVRGGHFWWLSADGELANVPNRKFPGHDAELRGNRLYVLCWPSVHPTGVQYEWLYRCGKTPPAISIRELNWLPVRLALEVRSKFELRDNGRLGCLSRSTLDFIDNGALDGTRNDRFFAAACDMRGNNFAYEEADDLLVPVALTYGLTQSEIRYSLKSAYSKLRSPTKQSKKNLSELAPDWLKARYWADSHHWQRMETVIEK